MKNKQEAIKTSSKIISIIMKIGYIATIVAMSICLACILFVAITGELSTMLGGSIRIVATDESITTVQGAVALFSATLIMSGFLFSVFFLTQRMFAEICSSGTPFNTKHVRTIKTVGILIAVMSFVGNIVNGIASKYAEVSTLGMSTDITGIIFGLIVFCLAYIFDYGCTLQELSDETL